MFASYACGLILCCTNEEENIVVSRGRAYRVTTQRMTQEEIYEAAGTWGIYLAYLIFPLMRIFGAPGAQAYATLGLLFQQHYYNSLLFRKGFRDFLLGLIVGVLFVIVDIELPPIEQDEEEDQNDQNDQNDPIDNANQNNEPDL